MIINPTKKTLNLFTALKQVEDSLKAKEECAANPLYSWHASYINVERKKILILINDRTFLPIVIDDVNAQRKKELDLLIKERIHTIFRHIGLKEQQISDYFSNAGILEVNAAHNRTVISIMNQQVQRAKWYDRSYDENYAQELQQWLLMNIFAKLNYKYPAEETLEVFDELLIKQPAVKLMPQSKHRFKIKKNWKSFDSWVQYVDGIDEEDYERICLEIRENNQYLLAEFQTYLMDCGNIKDDVIELYMEYIDLYINEYLLNYGIRTVTTDMDDPYEFLEDWLVRKVLWRGHPEVKVAGNALKKFYMFLQLADELRPVDVKRAKGAINEGVELGMIDTKFDI